MRYKMPRSSLSHVKVRRNSGTWVNPAWVLASSNPAIHSTVEPASLEISAGAAAGGEGKPSLKTFTMTAYTGVPVVVAGYYYPIVVDLQGMKVAGQQIPILKDHDSTQVVGHTEKVEVTPQRVKSAGVISGVGDAAQEITATAANKFPWGASIGASVEKLEFLDRGETATVNGRTVTGPKYIARESTLREITVTAIGADAAASTSIAAHLLQESFTMNFDQWLAAQHLKKEDLNAQQLSALQATFNALHPPTPPTPPNPGIQGGGANPPTPPVVPPTVPPVDVTALRAAHAAELERINAVQIEAKDHPEIAAKAVKEGWDLTKTQLEVIRASRPTGPAIHIVNTERTPEIWAAAVCMAGKLNNVEKVFQAQTLEAAHKNYRTGIGLQQLMLEAAWSNGYRGLSFKDNMQDVIRAAFSTQSLSGILSATANKFLLAGYMNVDGSWRKISARRNVSDFKTVTSYRMTGAFTFEQVGPTGELKHDVLGEQSFTNKADTYGKMYAITRVDLINDDLGALTDVPSRIGRGAALKFNDVFWTAFLANSSFFQTSTGSYFTGAATNLQSSSLKTAVSYFRKQVDADSKPLGAQPKYLLVPPEEEVTAQELYVSTNVNNGTTAQTPDRNVFASKYEPVVSPYLSNSSYTGYSTTAWYLLADPADIAVIEACFLNGNEQPTVESADADFSTLGIQMRGYFDFGVTKQDYRGGVKSKGAA